MTTSVRETLSSADMAKALHISEKLLQRIRKMPDSPFKDGVHYRYQGVTIGAPIRWFPAATDEAFSSFTRVSPDAIETMDGGEA